MVLNRSLRDELSALFTFGLAECASHAELGELGASLSHWQRAVEEPMRVAFVGKTNCGKSTMLNAFLAQELAPTGNGELTFNVSWLRYGERSQLRVHTVDGTVESETFESLAQLTARCEKNQALLERIRFIEVLCPNPLLKNFDLIDTPGLHSFYVKDSRNTQALLTDPRTRPHALVFMFSGALQRPDVEELERFHESCGTVMSGLTAIGALTKVDEARNTFEDGRRTIEQLEKQHPNIRRYFYAIEPVVGPLAFGAQTLTELDLRVLASLARLEPEQLSKLSSDVRKFCEREYDRDSGVPPAAERSKLFARLGRFGIHAAVALLRTGIASEELPRKLLEQSRVEHLRKIVTSHFGNRALLIKARSALAVIRDQAFITSERIRGPGAVAARRIAGRIDTIVANELRFREFSVLERYYAGAVELDEASTRQLLEVTGENGSDCWRRLGAAPDTPLGDLQKRAEQRERLWRQSAYDSFAGLELQESARVLADSYGEIHARLSEAAGHLEKAKSLLAYEQ